MRIRKKAWTEKEISQSEALIKPETLKTAPLSEIFGNNNPIYLEIGCGKGGFIIQNALKYPEINFIGLERSMKVLAIALRKHREIAEPPKNLIFLNMDAGALLDTFTEKSFGRIYINFCDPWPGRLKWAKRRLTHRGFLQTYRKLLNDGTVCFRTDDVPLFEFSVTEFTEDGWQLLNVSRDLHTTNMPEIMTEYEQKFSSQGKPINGLEARPNAGQINPV